VKGGEERRRAGGGEENESRRRCGGGGRRGLSGRLLPCILKFVGGKLSSGAPRHGCATATFFLFFSQNLKPEKSPISVFQLTNPFFLQTAIGL
jgi:hypothetical protein